MNVPKIPGDSGHQRRAVPGYGKGSYFRPGVLRKDTYGL